MIAPLDDLDRIMVVMQSAFDPAFGEAWTRRQVEDALVVGNCHYALISTAGEIPAGEGDVAGFFLSRHGVEEEELLLLAVAPHYRRRGLATRLLRRFTADARQRGALRLLLEMRRDNDAESLYRAHGFSPIGERRNYYRRPDGSRIDAITFASDCN
jgi:ribosomal-protein-alanine N-acetyltransferase